MKNTLEATERKKSSGTRNVLIPKEPVELYKILKFEAMVGSGGEAKAAVSAGRVLLNGKVETQKRKIITVSAHLDGTGMFQPNPSPTPPQDIRGMHSRFM